MNGEAFLNVASADTKEAAEFAVSLNKCPKTGLHNPLRDVERYRMLADVSLRAADAMRQPETFDFFSKLVQRTSPKSWAQAQAEVRISRQFLDNFTGDNVRFLARSFGVPGDHLGQTSNGHRFPFGPVAIVTPFNFPIEIPALQVSALASHASQPVYMAVCGCVWGSAEHTHTRATPGQLSLAHRTITALFSRTIVTLPLPRPIPRPLFSSSR